MSTVSLGGSPIGGELSGVFGTAPDALRVAVEGKDLTSFYRPGTLSVEEQISARHTFRFDLRIDASYSVQLGQDVEILHWGELVFRGVVLEVRKIDSVNPNAAFLSVSGSDYNYLADRFVFSANYETVGQTLRDIVVDIVTVQAEGLLALEGVTTEFVEQGPPIKVAKFPYRTIREAFTEIADATGYLWMIDREKRLLFFDRLRWKAPYSLGTGGNANHFSIVSSQVLDDYRNRQLLIGGLQLTDQITETFKGDGARTTFSLALPISGLPTVRVNSVVKTVGVRKQDGNQVFDWYYQERDKDISQDSDGTVLTSSDTLDVNYSGLVPIIIEDLNDSEISARKLVEGGTGRYDHVDQDDEVNTFDLATSKLEELVRRFGRLHTQIEVDTPVWGLRVGQLLDATESSIGVSGSFVITGVSIRDAGVGQFRLQVDATSGEGDGGWVSFFKQLVSAGHVLTIRENEILTISRKRREQVALTDSATALTDVSGLAAVLSDPYTSARIGTTAGLPSAVIGFAMVGRHPLDP